MSEGSSTHYFAADERTASHSIAFSLKMNKHSWRSWFVLCFEARQPNSCPSSFCLLRNCVQIIIIHPIKEKCSHVILNKSHFFTNVYLNETLNWSLHKNTHAQPPSAHYCLYTSAYLLSLAFLARGMWPDVCVYSCVRDLRWMPKYLIIYVYSNSSLWRAEARRNQAPDTPAISGTRKSPHLVTHCLVLRTTSARPFIICHLKS